MAIKRSFILSSGIGVSADNLFVVNNTNSVSSTTGSIVLSGGIGIGQSASISGRLQMFNGANYTSFVSSATGNTVYTLPATSPATGSSVLQSTSAGVMSWVPMTATSGSSGLATTAENINTVAASTNANHHILFSPVNGGSGVAVSSDAGLLFNPASNTLTTNTFSAGVSVATVAASVSGSTASTTTTTGALVVTGGVGIGQSVSVGGRLQMFNGANYTAFVSSASGNTVYTLPATSPATGSSVLQSDTSGVLAWVPMTVSSSSGNTAQNIVVNTAGNANVFHPILFTPDSLSAGSAVSSDGTISFNPSTEILNVSGLAITSTTASTNSTSGALIVTGGVGIGGSLYVAGDLTINGTTTTINTVTLTVDDKNIELGSVATPSDVTAEGGGITLRGATDKSINWYTGTGWSSSESWNLASGNTYKINNTAVISNSSLGTGVTNSSLTALGTITTGVWSGTSITAFYGGTGLQTTFTVGDILYANTSSTWARLTANSNSGYVLTSAGSGATPTYVAQSTLSVGNATSSGIATTAQNINVISASTNANHPLLFTPSFGSASGLAVSSNTTLVYNPSSDILSVSGAAITSTTASNTASTGSLVVTGGVGIGQSVSVGGRLQLFNSSNYTAFVSSATGNTVYTLPATSPATGSSVLQSTSAGVLSWVPMTAGAASGNTAQNIVVNTAGNANVFHPVLFTPSSLSAGSAVSSDSTISFNPSTEILNVSGLAITSGTASTNTTTGALVVRGGLGVTGQLSFATASFGFTGITTNPTMSFIGATSSSPITLTVLTDNSLSFEGSQGSVFSIDSNLSSGEIFSVSDISGLPIISASAGQTVNINEFGGYTQIGNGSINSSSTSTGSLVVVGGLGITGNANIGGTVRITNTTNSSSTTTGALVVNGGAGITGNANIGGTVRITNTTNSSSITSGALSVNGGLGVTGNAFIGGTVNITNTTAATSVSSAALVVSGGLGVQGDLFVAANANTKLSIMHSSGDEGGEIFLNKPVTNTTITNGVTIDVFQNRLRIFEGGGSARGFYLDITTGGNGVATNIMGGSSSGTVNSGTATYAAFYPASSNAVSENANLQFTGTGISIGGNIASTSTTSGSLWVYGGVGIGQSVSVGGRLQMFNGANYTAFVSSATGNTVYTLPATSPATGTSYLTSNSAGIMSWTAPTKTNYVLSFGAGFTPTASSADSVSLNIPFAPDGTSKYYFVKRIEYRNETLSGGTGLSFYLERHTSGNASWTTTNTITAGSGASFLVGAAVYSSSFTTISSSAGVAGSVVSGDYVRLFFTSVGSAANVSIAMTIEEQ